MTQPPSNPPAGQETATPRTDALTSRLYGDCCADAAGFSASVTSPEEAYGLAIDLAQTLERELAAAKAKLSEGLCRSHPSIEALTQLHKDSQ